MPDADVTVSIVNHRNRELLLENLASLVEDEQRRARLDIVVLDNASEDGSVEAVRLNYPRIRLITQAHRAGFGANHNRILRSSSARFVFLLNDDAVVPPGVIDGLVAHLDADPRVAAVSPRIVAPDGRVQQVAWRLPRPAVAVWSALTLGKVGIVQSSGDAVRPVEALSACALMLRRSAFEEIGFFDEEFFMYAEDLDISRRLADAGWELHYHPGFEVLHHSGMSSARAPASKLNEQARGLRRYWRKHHGRAGARTAVVATAASFYVRATIGDLLVRLPDRVRPARTGNWPPEEFRAMGRALLRGPSGPGLREAAVAFNSERGEPS